MDPKKITSSFVALGAFTGTDSKSSPNSFTNLKIIRSLILASLVLSMGLFSGCSTGAVESPAGSKGSEGPRGLDESSQLALERVKEAQSLATADELFMVGFFWGKIANVEELVFIRAAVEGLTPPVEGKKVLLAENVKAEVAGFLIELGASVSIVVPGQEEKKLQENYLMALGYSTVDLVLPKELAESGLNYDLAYFGDSEKGFKQLFVDYSRYLEPEAVMIFDVYQDNSKLRVLAVNQGELSSAVLTVRTS